MKANIKNNLPRWYIFFLVNFFIFFYGLRIALEEYLLVDETAIVYAMAIAFLSGVIAYVSSYLLKDKKMRYQVVSVIISLTLVILLNLYLYYIY